MRWVVVALGLAVAVAATACGDDAGPSEGDDAAITGADAGPSSTDGGGGGTSTVGRPCANDDNCTGPGERCCLDELPTACRLEVDCPGTMSGIPCDATADCPNGGNVCCRVGTDQFCTRPMTCEGFGGEQLP